jgi:hypothetical protein
MRWRAVCAGLGSVVGGARVVGGSDVAGTVSVVLSTIVVADEGAPGEEPVVAAPDGPPHPKATSVGKKIATSATRPHMTTRDFTFPGYRGAGPVIL